MNGLGSSFHMSTQARISFSSVLTDLCTPRRRSFSVNSPNQRCRRVRRAVPVPDRYSYRHGDQQIGAGVPILDCAATGMVQPAGLPTVVWRAGLDLNPLDVTDPADLRWLGALVWPEHTHRRAR
jgi:Uncharacterized protein conserved in bacteria (DUF2332)